MQISTKIRRHVPRVMTSLLSSLHISISHQLFRHRYSNSGDTVACSPSFSFPATRVPRRACWQAITLLKQNIGLILLTLTVIPFYGKCWSHCCIWVLKLVLCHFLWLDCAAFQPLPLLIFLVLALLWSWQSLKNLKVNVTENIGHTTNKQT